MKTEFLSIVNVEKYISYLKQALIEEPEEMLIDCVDEDSIISRVKDKFYKQTKSILAILDDKVIGRIEYHFYGCIQDGFKMAYVDWVYVLRNYRKQGVAKALFNEFEKDCKNNKINQYFLIRATSESANSFYNSFQEVELKVSPTLRKDL
ncbi:MAG: GNAT family N-acetyltransferase [Clostridiales bacterium]|nr:GNAT family N-acetyltransferase [Clostridiales bacterium]